MKKKNDNSKYFSEWTTKKLKDYYKSYNDSIYGESACYGMSDLRMLNALGKELERRKVVISSEIIFK